MKQMYFIRSGARILPEEGLIIGPGPDSLRVDSSSMEILKKLSWRPLFPEEVQLLPREISDHLLRPVKLKLNDLTTAYADFVRCPDEVATAWILRAPGNVTYHWGPDLMSLPKGIYLLPQYRPLFSPDTKIRLTPVRSIQPRILREEWIISTLKMIGATSILELGCGDSRTLEEKFIRENPAGNYLGIDKNISPRARRVKGDFLSALPEVSPGTVAVAEEVIEHLHPESVESLVRNLKEKKFSNFLMTTPNQKFSHLLGHKFRHSDHKFEWHWNEARTWARKIDKSLGTHTEIRGIGKKWKGVYPTWGIIIRLN